MRKSIIAFLLVITYQVNGGEIITMYPYESSNDCNFNKRQKANLWVATNPTVPASFECVEILGGARSA